MTEENGVYDYIYFLLKIFLLLLLVFSVLLFDHRVPLDQENRNKKLILHLLKGRYSFYSSFSWCGVITLIEFWILKILVSLGIPKKKKKKKAQLQYINKNNPVVFIVLTTVTSRSQSSFNLRTAVILPNLLIILMLQRFSTKREWSELCTWIGTF